MISVNEVAELINLDLIEVSETNQMFRKPKDLSEKGLKELANSIKQDGLIQSILVRPNESKPGYYILIAGERRLRASKIAGLTAIPAKVRSVDESKALKLQMIENLQRENVHAMYEAEGYKYLLDNDENLTTAKLAWQFGRTESYVLQRLKLNDLVAEGRKDFLSNVMTLGHALIIAKLTPADQKSAIERITRHNKGYGSIPELQEYVNREIIQDLSSAPFSVEDADLLPSAGNCTSCSKRSGAAPLLFGIKEKDRCIDRSCFFMKCKQFLINRTKQIIETQPEVVFLVDYNDPIAEISEMLQAHNIKPLKEYNDFSEYNKTGNKVTGFWISGQDAGKTLKVYISKKATGMNGSDAGDEKVLIEKIQSRVKRGVELDQEKIYGRILEDIKKHPTQKKDSNKKLLADEEALLWFIILDKAGWNLKPELRKYLGLTKDSPEKLYTILRSLKSEQKAFLLRKVMLDQFGGIHPQSEYGFIIRKIAESYGDIDIATIEKEQVAIRTKRESNANKRIADLKATLKEKKSTSSKQK